MLYELSPPSQGTTWIETTYKLFPMKGGRPISEVNIDSAGALYMTASTAPPNSSAQCGAVMKFTPKSGGGGIKQEVAFSDTSTVACTPLAGVLLNPKNGAIFGTSEHGMQGSGSVFEITGGKAKSIYGFCQLSGCADGLNPAASLTPDRKGNLYSTTTAGGQFNLGVVFELTP